MWNLVLAPKYFLDISNPKISWPKFWRQTFQKVEDGAAARAEKNFANFWTKNRNLKSIDLPNPVFGPKVCKVFFGLLQQHHLRLFEKGAVEFLAPKYFGAKTFQKVEAGAAARAEKKVYKLLDQFLEIGTEKNKLIIKRRHIATNMRSHVLVHERVQGFHYERHGLILVIVNVEVLGATQDVV